MIRTSLATGMTHEAHQYIPNVSKKFRMKIYHRNSNVNLCQFIFDTMSIELDDQYLVKETKKNDGVKITLMIGLLITILVLFF